MSYIQRGSGTPAEAKSARLGFWQVCSWGGSYSRAITVDRNGIKELPRSCNARRRTGDALPSRRRTGTRGLPRLGVELLGGWGPQDGPGPTAGRSATQPNTLTATLKLA